MSEINYNGLTSGPVFTVRKVTYHKNPDTCETYIAHIHMDNGKWYVEEATSFYTWPRPIMED